MAESKTPNRAMRRAEQRKKSTAQSGNSLSDLKAVNNGLSSLPNEYQNLNELNPDMLKELSLNLPELNTLNGSRNEAPQSPIGISAQEAGIEPKVRTPRFKKLKKSLQDLISSIAVPMLAISPADALVLIQHADSYSDCWIDLAEKDDRVAKALESLLQGEVYTALIIETGAITIAILKNHGIDVLAWIIGLLKPQAKQPGEKQPQSTPASPPVHTYPDRDADVTNRLFAGV